MDSIQEIILLDQLRAKLAWVEYEKLGFRELNALRNAVAARMAQIIEQSKAEKEARGNGL